jgi:hypothetical protein
VTSRREPAPQPDPRLDRYRKAAARLYDGETVAAHLLTRVDVWWTTQGPWWRRRHVNPQERVAWLLNFQPGFDLAHPDGWDDGIDAEVPDLDQDRFLYRGRPLRVAWLDGQEAEEQFSPNGWERHD